MSTSPDGTRLDRTRPHRTRRDRTRIAAAATLSVLAGALLLGACSSSSTPGSTHSSGSGSTSTTTPQLSAASLQQWPSSTVTVTESGSTLLQPLFTSWAASIAKQWPTVTVSPSGGGSGQGITNAAAGTSNIGASDAYLSEAQVTANPGLANIPVAISAQQVNYNVPGLPSGTNLKLTGTILAGMYGGTITKWNDSAIAQANPGVTLPNLSVVPIHRTDSSGDTFLFSSYLAASDPTWGAKYPPGTTVQWPAVGSSANGNGGMVTACKAAPGCVAYIGVSYLNQTTQAGLGYAALQNKAGNYVLPSATTIAAEAQGFASQTPPSGTVSMIYGPAAQGYPIVNYEYAIVGKQADAAHVQAVKAVLAWAVDPNGGNASSFLDAVNFQPLPASVEQISLRMISQITS